MSKPKRKRRPTIKSALAERVIVLLQKRPRTWLSEESGVKLSKVRDFLLGRAKGLYADELAAIAGVFGMTADELAGELLVGPTDTRDQGIAKDAPGGLGVERKSVDRPVHDVRTPKKGRRLG